MPLYRAIDERGLSLIHISGLRLDRVRLTKDDPIHDMLEFYMGKNSYERQGFIIDNLRIEEDIVAEDLGPLS